MAIKKVGLTSCSNGHHPEWEDQIDELVSVLAGMGIEAVRAEHIISKIDDFAGTDEERARDLMKFYEDDSIDAIFDISGGDLANGVLKYLDFDVIAKSKKLFWGYSDLTTIINAIYTRTGKESVLYQVKNMVWSEAQIQQKRFTEYLRSDSITTANGIVTSANRSIATADGDSDNPYDCSLFNIDYDFLQGSSMEGIVVGGNIRCLTKLAGTQYWPDMTDKILFLESLGGECGQIATLFTQLDNMGVFDKVAGVILGTFTNYEKADLELSVYDLLKMHISPELPVAHTPDIGHGKNSKAIVIGKEMFL